MPKRLKVPQYAKNLAKQGLEEREKNRAGLSPAEARKLGIYSGVARAKQIISNRYLDEKDLRSIARFYSRFKNCKTPKCETALKLWGGRRFGKFLYGVYYG